MLHLLLGGARSGKSALALELALAAEEAAATEVVFIATAEALDDEMGARIAAHRARRPPRWSVVEEPVHISDALARIPGEAVAIIDCLTLWAANAIDAGMADDNVLSHARQAAEKAAARPGLVVVVSNEVGSGIVPVNDLARRYRDLLGQVNMAFSDHAERAWLVVAGRALVLGPSAGAADGAIAPLRRPGATGTAPSAVQPG